MSTPISQLTSPETLPRITDSPLAIADTAAALESPDFDGAIVAQFESRLSASMDNMVRRHGGNSWLALALSEVPVTDDPAVPVALDQLVARHFDLVVLLTGVGTRNLFEAAQRAGVFVDVRAAMHAAEIVCRGPKPVHALRQQGIKPRHLVPEPHTTAELLDYIGRLPLAGKQVLITSAGEKMREPSEFLVQKGAHPLEIQLYRWDLASSDADRLAETTGEIIAGRIDLAAFTTQVQVRHLFDVATRLGERDQLAAALRNKVIVGAVGPTCADALRQYGIEPDVIPEHPKMGHLVVALARASEAHRNRRSER